MTDSEVRRMEGENPNLDAALAHVRAGRPVFPCNPVSKEPFIRHGFKAASRDESDVRAWWAWWPKAVPGMPTGQRVGVWVLDVDCKPGQRGEESLAELQDAYGRLPDTVEAITATGGRHLYFRHPCDGRLIPNSASKLGAHLDVRGDGGYVILPGAVMATGGRYCWEGSSDPDEGARAVDAPDWLLAMVVKPDEPAQPGGGAVDGEPVTEGGRNEYLYKLGCSLRAKGLGEAAILAALRAINAERCVPPLSDDEVAHTARSAASKTPGLSPDYERKRAAAAQRAGAVPPGLRVVGGTAHDGRPTVRMVNGRLPEAVDDAEHHLIARGGIFQHGTRLVRVGQWDMTTGVVERPIGAGVLIDISPEWLCDALTRAVRWERFDARKGEFKPIDCPSKVGSTLLARAGSWRFPGLVGFCDSPTLAPDGRLITARGYDVQTGLYLSRPPEIAPIGAIGRDDILWARETLGEAAPEFPFVTDNDRSAFFAMILTALLRRVLPAAPIGCISANTPATGKSKLADIVSIIATGRMAAVAALGATPEELEKRIDSVLLKGDTMCSFDNVDRPVKSDVLCQVSTQPIKSIRVMGLSKMVEAPTNVALMMTGNNLTLIGDLVRRCVVANLDAQCERPELRTFKSDAIEDARRNRPELIRAALTIAKGYLDAGCPRVEAPPFGSFELWDRLVRRALIWAGCPDPLTPAEAMREQDHELAGMRDFLREWQAVDCNPLTAAELAELVRARRPGMGDDWEPKHPALREAAVLVMGDTSKWSARDLGYRLRSMAGRMFDGRRIVKASKGVGGVRWSVESIQG